MFRTVLNKAINYYSQFDYITIVDESGTIEYSAMYCKDSNYFRNEGTTGIHILDLYPGLDEKESSILKSLRTGREIYNTLQELTDIKGNSYFLISTDFPILFKGEPKGVVEVSVKISKSEYLRYISDRSIVKKRLDWKLDDIITKDPTLMELKNNILKIAKTDSSVMIIGETGTGKDMIAQALHSHSYRKNEKYVSQNCSAIPFTLLESTFFGTVKGAFTGAENTIGLFELADEGTLFLDEINSMDLALQPKILKAIEDKKIRRLGSTSTKSVNVRVISAMNISVEEALNKNLLREDLFYRLGVVRLSVPPLRERKGDIELLSNFFIKKYNQEMGKNIQSISSSVLRIFRGYSWPGNVRELKNVIEYCFNIIDEGDIEINHIPEYLSRINEEEFNEISIKSDIQNIANDIFLKSNIYNDLEEKSLTEKVNDYEKSLIECAIKNTDSLVDASKLLKISPQSLNYKINKYNIKKSL